LYNYILRESMPARKGAKRSAKKRAKKAAAKKKAKKPARVAKKPEAPLSPPTTAQGTTG